MPSDVNEREPKSKNYKLTSNSVLDTVKVLVTNELKTNNSFERGLFKVGDTIERARMTRGMGWFCHLCVIGRKHRWLETGLVRVRM
jgi:hypothetical protein